MGFTEDLALIEHTVALLTRFPLEITSVTTTAPLQISLRAARSNLAPGQLPLNFALNLIQPTLSLGWTFLTYSSSQDHISVTIQHPSSPQ